ncbi:unnamed protein product [Leptosia nina]|uniref:Uncharacterized protein n=1 Tax=Leptosia nina TaxID=320188 RepID=A0AAV1JVQ2_9NEOP
MTQKKVNENQKKKRRKRKKKRTFCQRCRRRICRWLYRRIKRCCKKTIFGVPDPKLSDYEIGGINLADAKDKLQRKKSKSIKDNDKKKSIVTLYKNKKKSAISVPFKDKLLKEYEDISLLKPKGSTIKSLFNDLKERNLYVGLSKDSKLNLTKSDREKFRQKANEYEEKYNKDYKDKYKKASYLKNYEDKYKKKSILDLNLLEKMDKAELKKKLSITSSKHKVLKSMLSDYKKKKFSITQLFGKSKVDLDKLDKDDLKKVLEIYKDKDKAKNIPFVKQSKLKQLKSDWRAKLAKLY